MTALLKMKDYLGFDPIHRHYGERNLSIRSAGKMAKSLLNGNDDKVLFTSDDGQKSLVIKYNAASKANVLALRHAPAHDVPESEPEYKLLKNLGYRSKIRDI